MAGKESPPVYVTRKVFTAPGVWGPPQAPGQASPVPGLESEDEGSGSGASSFLGFFFSDFKSHRQPRCFSFAEISRVPFFIALIDM